MKVLAVAGLVKRYGRHTALRGVDLTVGAGELVGLLGPNGAGKSTLTKIACGLTRPTSGRAEVCGRSPATSAARANIGYLPELFRFPPWLSGLEVLALHQRLAHSSGGEAELRSLLDLVGLGAVADRKVGAMSKGMQQRLGLAQALIGTPKLLLLDEPTSALDPAGRRLVRDVLRELKEGGSSVLLNSHLLSEVELVCDRVAILQQGSVVAEGSPDELLTDRGVVIETSEGPRSFPEATRSDVPRIVAELVRSGVSIYEVRPARSSLEEFYLEKVGDEIS